MKNRTKALIFVSSLLAGISALSLAFAPVQAAPVNAPTVIELPELVITASPSVSNLGTLPEVVITGRRHPVKAPTKVTKVPPMGERVSLHVLRQGGRPGGDFVLVRD